MLTAYFCMFSIANLPRLMNGQESTKNKQFNSRLISSNTAQCVCIPVSCFSYAHTWQRGGELLRNNTYYVSTKRRPQSLTPSQVGWGGVVVDGEKQQHDDDDDDDAVWGGKGK